MQSPLSSPVPSQTIVLPPSNIKQQFVSTTYWPQQSPSPTIMRTQSPSAGSVAGPNTSWHGTFAKPKPPSR